MRTVLLLLALAALSGCGLRPLYGGAAGGGVARALGGVQVAPIDGKAGWLMRQALEDRVSATDQGRAPTYRLQVELDDRITGFGVRADDAITRERRTLRARYQLIETANGQVVLDETAGSDAGIDVVSSDYAAIAAENTALENLTRTVADQIVARIALYARRAPATE